MSGCGDGDEHGTTTSLLISPAMDLKFRGYKYNRGPTTGRDKEYIIWKQCIYDANVYTARSIIPKLQFVVTFVAM
jgi:hypothetical protein